MCGDRPFNAAHQLRAHIDGAGGGGKQHLKYRKLWVEAGQPNREIWLEMLQKGITDGNMSQTDAGSGTRLPQEADAQNSAESEEKDTQKSPESENALPLPDASLFLASRREATQPSGTSWNWPCNWPVMDAAPRWDAQPIAGPAFALPTHQDAYEDPCIGF